jgi:hypothetical protein
LKPVIAKCWLSTDVGRSFSARCRLSRIRNSSTKLWAIGQDGYNNRIGAKWNDISKGLLKSKLKPNDEEQMRVSWRRWKALLNGTGAQPLGDHPVTRDMAMGAQ